MSGLSKIAGLPQMKLGWIVIAGPAPARAEAREKLELIADTYLSVGTPVQHAAARLLELGQAIHQQIANAPEAIWSCFERLSAQNPPVAYWRWKAAGVPHCKCRASAAKKNGRWSFWPKTMCWCSPASFTISNPRPSWCSAC